MHNVIWEAVAGALEDWDSPGRQRLKLLFKLYFKSLQTADLGHEWQVDLKSVVLKVCLKLFD